VQTTKLTFNEMHVKFIILFCLIYCFSICIFAQSFKCKVELSAKEIKQNQSFQIFYTIENKSKPIAIIPFFSNDFTIIDSIKSMVVNDKISKYAIKLIPKNIGTIIIPKLKYNCGTKNFTSNETTIIVIDSTQELLTDQEKKILAELDKKPNSENNASEINTEKEGNEQLYEGNQIFIETAISNEHPYIGEQVNVCYYLLSKASTDISPIEYPKIYGCWVKDIIKNEDEIKIDTIAKNGSYYMRYLIYKFALFPLSDGKKVMPSIIIKAKAQLETQASTNSRDGQLAKIFNFSAVEKRNVKIISKEKILIVKPLPTVPKNFDGLIGAYNFTTTVDTNSILANQSVIINYTINGKGNLPFTVLPKPNFGDDWETGEPQITDTNFFENDILYATKKIKYILVPQRNGKLLIPAKTMACFNTATLQYESDTMESKLIDVITEQDYIKSNANQLQDIVATKLETNIQIDFYRWQYWLWYLLPIGFITSTFIYLNKKKKKEIVIEKKLLGNETVEKITSLNQFIDTNQLETFCSTLLYIFNQYFSNKLKIPIASLQKNKIMEMLAEKNIPLNCIQEYDTIEKKCTEYVYAKIGDQQSIATLLPRSIAFIQTLENIII
jgi:BatD DUF11 like domain